jgi:hypothetical protein
VNLYFEAPEGIRVVPAHAQITRGQKQIEVTLIADDRAPVGLEKIRIMGEPESGSAVLQSLPVQVGRD